ncbi:MAG TPA: dynamin family protein [Streptosporangiaceae bacterium]|nr:dynamin family protein [Streptosporangiaceae bacterium]
MDGLIDYQQRRLELADMIRAVLPVAHAHGDDQREQQIRKLLTRLAAGRFQLAVVGQFSRGKTTLMNALLGGAYLPMGALPMTSVVTTVRYGTRPRALVRGHAAALPVEVPVTEVATFVAQAGAERTRMQVTSVEVEIPAELLRLGFEFIDTPGVGSAIATNTATTLRYLPQADAIVFVTGFDSALTSIEADFLAAAAGSAGKLFVVINKRDLVSDTDAEDVTAYVRRWTRDNLPADPPAFAVSALQALNGAEIKDVRQLAHSGIDPLRDALTEFLSAEQGRVALSNIRTAAAGLVARQQRDLQVSQRTRCADSESQGVTFAFESRMSELHDRLSTVADRIAATAGAAATAVLAERMPAWEAQMREILAAVTAAAGSAAAAPDEGAVFQALEVLRVAGRQAAGDWLQQHAAEMQEVLIAAAAADIGILLDLARSPRELGASIAGLSAFDGTSAGWAVEEIPQLTVPGVDWNMPGQPGRSWRRRGVRFGEIILAAVNMAVADLAGHAQAAFRVAVADWARRLRDQAEQMIVSEAAQFRRYLSAPPSDDDLALLTGLASRLAAFGDALAAWIPDAVRPTAPVAAPSAAEPLAASPAGPGAACTICGQLAAAQAEYLIHRQFLLATREADQARHAETGGFCSLHMWQYAHLASPVGISAGNAELASRLAGALHAADADSRHPGELAARVTTIARTRTCPACAVLGEAERQAIGEIAELPPRAAEAPLLCLRHLALVLEACSSLPAGRAMTTALSVTLQRTSENMRAYSLKREALRRWLVTADEESAYTDAIRLLAGEAALALPAQPE